MQICYKRGGLLEAHHWTEEGTYGRSDGEGYQGMCSIKQCQGHAIIFRLEQLLHEIHQVFLMNNGPPHEPLEEG